MIILVDTNLLCRLCNSAKPPSADATAARRALRTLRNQGHTLAIAPQKVFEFWSVATRPPGSPPVGANGLGMSAERADLWIAYFLRNFTLLSETGHLLTLWRNLVRTYAIIGYKSHDARLVAMMQAQKIDDLLTFNDADFKRFPFINVIDPKSV